MLLSSATPPAGAPNDEHFVALRLEALYRSGLLADMESVLEADSAAGPVVQTLRARRDIGLGAARRRLPGDQGAGRAQLRACPAASRARRSCWSAIAQPPPTMRTPLASPPTLRARKASTPNCRSPC